MALTALLYLRGVFNPIFGRAAACKAVKMSADCSGGSGPGIKSSSFLAIAEITGIFKSISQKPHRADWDWSRPCTARMVLHHPPDQQLRMWNDISDRNYSGNILYCFKKNHKTKNVGRHYWEGNGSHDQMVGQMAFLSFFRRRTWWCRFSCSWRGLRLLVQEILQSLRGWPCQGKPKSPFDPTDTNSLNTILIRF